MSYPVRVVVKETVRDRVQTRDELKLTLSNDPVLRKAAARQRLRELLAEHGWDAQEPADLFVKTRDDGVQVTWDLEANELRLSTESATELERSGHKELRGDSMTREGAGRQEEELKAAGREQLRKQLADQLDADRETAERDLLDAIHERLEAAHEAVAAEVNGMLETVYRDWLVEQAKTLGNVVGQHESVSPDGDVYELTIRIAQ